MFKVCARTVLELGAELISSDVIAFYELIKNAFDAGSKSGAEINFRITLRRHHYLRFRREAERGNWAPDRLKQQIINALDSSAPSKSRSRFKSLIENAKSYKAIVRALDRGYALYNRIIVSDEGSGMSKQDLIDNYLVIGTPSRKRDLDEAIKRGPSSNSPPFLGEKGIGRLSAMRLGDTLRVKTALRTDRYYNILKIDWSDFDNLDAMLDEIDLAPERGKQKPEKHWSGTKLYIGQLTSDWTLDRVKNISENDFAKLTDPFTTKKRRPRIAVFWNNERIVIPRMDRELLNHAHASAKGRLKYIKNKTELEPCFEYELEAIDLGFEHPYEISKNKIVQDDLDGLVCGKDENIPFSTLDSLGEFSFEVYWFNRRRLSAIDGMGDQRYVRDLQQSWSGILLFRDGFRILPYGEEYDDWLSLDRKALSGSGYLLNKTQFVGRVNITRFGNQELIDQTNREGLRVCPEQQAFIELLKIAIQEKLRAFLRDFEKRHKDQPIDLSKLKTDVGYLEKRTKSALKRIKKLAPDARSTILELQDSFEELKEFFNRAERRIEEVENEKKQMVQMAGVGLLIEVVAHELARQTENALGSLADLHGQEVPKEIEGLLGTLQAEMKSLNKRVRILDPLSISGRQRFSVFNMCQLVEDILSGHAAQFKRHDIDLDLAKEDKMIRVRAVKGMIIQIIENLISNSLYWLDLRRKQHHGFNPQIKITIGNDPLMLTYEDNGPGISLENRDNVFRAFFSLKEKSKRRGLGLYIARECAEYHDGTLTLEDQVNSKSGRLHRFVLELPDERLV